MELIRENSCCFTGHRVIPARDLLPLRAGLRREVERLSHDGMDIFMAGGALGFDTLAAQEVLRVQAESYPAIHLVLVLPCLGQESKWSRQDAAVYRELLRRASEVIYTGDVYERGCMFRRNRYLVDHSSRCVCYDSGRGRGGTAYTVQYAKRQGLQVVNLWKPLPPEEG